MRSDKVSFTEKAKTSERDESTGIKLQYDPNLITVACSYTELFFLRKNWEFRKRGRSLKKAKFSHVNVQVLSNNMVIVSSP